MKMQNDKIARTDGWWKTGFRNWAMHLIPLTMIPLTFLGFPLRFWRGLVKGMSVKGMNSIARFRKVKSLACASGKLAVTLNFIATAFAVTIAMNGSAADAGSAA